VVRSDPAPVVVVVRFSAIGDIVLTTGAVTALARAWPEAEIVYATKHSFAPLVVHHPHVSRVVTLGDNDSFWSFALRLRASRPAAWVDLHDKMRSLLLGALVSAPRHVVWQKRKLADEIKVRWLRRPYHSRMQIAARYHRAVEELIGQTQKRAGLGFVAAQEDLAQAKTLLSAAGLDLTRPMAGICPGSVWETKRWPSERFGQLAERLVRQGIQVIVLGSSSERTVAAQVLARAESAHDLTGRLTLGELGAVISLCAVFIANDSGPMHISRALGVPTLAFFGSTDPGQFDFTGHVVRFAGVNCSPCSFYGLSKCPKGHFRCMLDLDVESTWRALQPLLDGSRRAAVLG
jgi:heptosyltransferase-2